MITGLHSIVYSQDAKADLGFFKDILKLNYVDVGKGWLIFGLPPAEIAVHPSTEDNKHEIYLLSDDIEAFVKKMNQAKVVCAPVRDQGWGLLTQVNLPGGGKLGVYQPRHARPKPMKISVKRNKKGTSGKSATKRLSKNSAQKKGRKAS
jgi:hypothetical protein